MGNTLVGPFSALQQLPAADLNDIDENAARALTKDDETLFTGNVTFDLNGNTFRIVGGPIEVEDWPELDTPLAITDYAPIVSWQFDPSLWMGEVHGSLSTTVGVSSTYDMTMDCQSTSAVRLVGLLHIPQGVTIATIKVPLRSPLSSALPASDPKVFILTGSSTAQGTVTTRAYQPDGSGSVGAFQAWHDVTCTFSFTLSESDLVYVVVDNMSGVDSVAGLRVGRPRISGTVASIRQV